MLTSARMHQSTSGDRNENVDEEVANEFSCRVRPDIGRWSVEATSWTRCRQLGRLSQPANRLVGLGGYRYDVETALSGDQSATEVDSFVHDCRTERRRCSNRLSCGLPARARPAAFSSCNSTCSIRCGFVIQYNKSTTNRSSVVWLIRLAVNLL